MGAEAEAGAEVGAVAAATPWSTLYKDPRGQYSAAMLGGAILALGLGKDRPPSSP